MNTENLYRIGRVTVDSSFHTQSADEAFFSYFGNDVTYSIKRTIYPDDAEKIEEFMKISKEKIDENIYSIIIN